MFDLERFGIKLGLDNMREFLSRIGNPHRDFRSVHVTGTNGKGSVCAFIASILSEEGLRTGLYTSPHLVDFRERVRVDGEMIHEDDVVRLGKALRSEMEFMASESEERQLTFFEFTTGLAFKHFSEAGIDIAVVEVGMGGRLDATNVISPDVTAITRIGREHTAYLGRAVKEIAREKAGIIKPGVPVIVGDKNPEARAVISRTCAAKSSPLKQIDRDFTTTGVHYDSTGTTLDYEGLRRIQGLRVPLIGAHQAENAAIAIAVCEELEGRGIDISGVSIRRGLEAVDWPARLDIWSVDPLIVIDGSHNPEGVAASTYILDSLCLAPMTYVVACMNDKDARGIVRALAPTAARIVVTEVDSDRSTRISDLGAIAAEEYKGATDMIPSPTDAIRTALEGQAGRGVCVIGSFYLAGEAIKWLEGEGDIPRTRVREPETRKV
ncbi:MAG: bifunctional folylpolyglutamate synthase/dihydrofolate synthase [Methanobacteriota archaeon]|nr:MAG: bifunctional folylpolyglutamate synthase/dihydrofolate synthase [Euryarchaeota archaeon]